MKSAPTDSRFSGVEAFKVYLGSSYEILFGIWYNLLYFYIGLWQCVIFIVAF